jgi:translation initiation factor 3 subunit G
MLDLIVSRAPKTSWADEVDELELPKNEEFVGDDGIRTTIEYTLNDEGKKIKVWLQDQRQTSSLV